MTEPTRSGLFLGGVLDPGSRTGSGQEVRYDPARFTTHGVIVGMTGSGKTGLGVVLLEELLLARVPVLILDPKGDMANLLLNFPELRGRDFRPWIDEGEADRQGTTPDAWAEETAARWREGLSGWGMDGERLRRLRDAADFVIHTPGSTAGIPLNVVGSLTAPPPDVMQDPEAVRDEIEGFASSLLALAGVDTDPITSPEHVLISTLLETAWRQGRDLDLASLIAQIQQPPLRKLGVFELDAFFPPADRRDLALRLNGLVASPSFASWLEGPPLDARALLYTPEGRPRASIIYMAHLSDRERQFVVTLVLSRMITWMRGQPGTSDLRALIYMDEVYGFVPPTAVPPSKKPILTILKQARAHGLGLVLSTQNPVDLDYKAMSNAGTWMVGRLQTERDKARILEALRSATGQVDTDVYDALIGGLDKRQFLLQTTRSPEPVLFTTRWAMSYLRGAMTRDEVRRLMEGRRREAPSASDPGGVPDSRPEDAAGAADPAGAGSTAERDGAALAADESPVAPVVSEAAPVRYLDPGAPWADRIGATPASSRYQAGLAARVSMVFDDRYANVDHREEWEAVAFPLPKRFDGAGLVQVDFDERDWCRAAPPDARYVVGGPDLAKSTYFREFERDLRQHLYHGRRVRVYRNRELGVYSRVGETKEDFAARCESLAEDRADEDLARLKDRHETRIERVRDQLVSAQRRVRELEVDVSGRKQTELVAAAGDLLSVFIGGRRRSRSLRGYATRRSGTRRAEERLATTEDKVMDRTVELEELEDELAREIVEITEKWAAAARQIEDVDIGLEKSDIHVERLTLFWAPVAPA